MNKKTLITIIIIVLLASLSFFYIRSTSSPISDIDNKQPLKNSTQTETSLTSSSWQWKETRYDDGKIIEPKEMDKFILSFNVGQDGSFSSTTDCNAVFGSYQTDGNNLTFGQIASTKMACPDIESQEQEFALMLSQAKDYSISDTNELIFRLDEGVMSFSSKNSE